VPATLWRALGLAPTDPNDPGYASPLPGDWERLAAQVPHNPASVVAALKQLNSHSEEERDRVKAALLIRAARAHEQIQEGLKRLSIIISPDACVRWKGILDILPKAESLAITLHPFIKLSGNLPPHVPVGKIDPVKAPSPGILLSTEMGLHLHIGSDNALALEMLWSQLEGVKAPTWSELVQYLRLPRRMDMAKETAAEILQSFLAQDAKAKELVELLSACTFV